uniref:Uncharacterized protein n=1 Tax=Romanomermis culicivorax TaxID=13658 RepID=A0A915HLQ9_ROMCU
MVTPLEEAEGPGKWKDKYGLMRKSLVTIKKYWTNYVNSNPFDDSSSLCKSVTNGTLMEEVRISQIKIGKKSLLLAQIRSAAG